MGKLRSASRTSCVKAKALAYNLHVRCPRKQTENCYIAKLPPKLLHRIVKNLPVFTRVLFMNTCHAFRTSLYHDARCVTKLPRLDVAEYLMCLARDRPNKWVCVNCLELHAVNKRGSPYKLGKKACAEDGSTDENCIQFNDSVYEIRHKHVQMALKYTRLSLDGKLSWYQRRHLRSLLEPFADRFRLSPNPKKKDDVIDLLIWPKVVKGRLVVWSCYRYRKHEVGDLFLLTDMGRLEICPHQSFNFKNSAWRDRPRSAFSQATEQAIRDRNSIGVSGCCPWCMTDFEVKYTWTKAEISVWKDLGPETSALMPAWRSLAFSPSFTTDIRFHGNKPGLVRRVYRGGEKDPNIPFIRKGNHRSAWNTPVHSSSSGSRHRSRYSSGYADGGYDSGGS